MTARLTRTARLAALPLLALAGSALFTAPAQAAENTRDAVSWAPSDEVVAVCDDGSRIGLGFDLVRNIHVHSDRTGEVLREMRNVNYTGIFEDLDSGERYTFQGTRIVSLDFEEGLFVSRGNYRTVTMPGAGTVLHESGMYVEDLDVEGLFYHRAGPDFDEWDLGGAEAVCSLFGLGGA